MTLRWDSDDGSSYTFDGTSGVRSVEEDDGIFNMQADLTVDQRVTSDGGVLLRRRYPPRRVVLNLLLEVSEGGVRPLWRQLLRSFTAGGRLIYEGISETLELRQVVLEGPRRSMLGQDMDYNPADVVSLSFLAMDPWWYGAIEIVSIPFSAPTPWDAAIPWDSPIPWNGGSSLSVSIAGDAPAYPAFVIQGPATGITVSTDDGAWEMDTTILGTGDLSAIQVEHRVGRRGPRYGSDLIAGLPVLGSVDWSLLTEASRVDWGLEPGDADLTIGSGGTDGNSALTMFYEPRYQSP